MVKSWWNNFSERGVAAPLSFFYVDSLKNVTLSPIKQPSSEMLHYFYNVTAFLLI